jgi:hypothetical protein
MAVQYTGRTGLYRIYILEVHIVPTLGATKRDGQTTDAAKTDARSAT